MLGMWPHIICTTTSCTAAHDTATATTTFVLQLPLKMMPMLPIALPLLTAALQLSYQVVDNWLLPNTNIPVSVEASWNWSYLFCYPVLPLLPLRCCIHLCASHTATTSTALPQISAPKHCLAAPLHFAPPDPCDIATIIKGFCSWIWSKSLGTSRILPLVCSPPDYNSMSSHLFSRGAWALSLDLFLCLRWSCLWIESLSLVFLPGTLGCIMSQLPTMEALYLGDVLLLPLPLLSRRC